jgi:hypothetical protein
MPGTVVAFCYAFVYEVPAESVHMVLPVLYLSVEIFSVASYILFLIPPVQHHHDRFLHDLIRAALFPSPTCC